MGRRRAPAGAERRRDADRSRQQLLTAALDEFPAKGFAGARVQDIAARAGVNKQLITYYFGGKEGLYRALADGWLENEATFARPELSLETLVVEYLHAVLDDPRWLRLLIWSGLAEQDAADIGLAERDERIAAADIAEFQRRQQQGELAADLDPGLSLLALMGTIAAPVVMPQIARRITGLEIDSPQFEERYAEELRRILRHLAGRSQPPEPGDQSAGDGAEPAS